MNPGLLKSLQQLEALQRARARALPHLPFIWIDYAHREAFMNSEPVSLSEANRAAARITAKQLGRAVAEGAVMLIVVFPGERSRVRSFGELEASDPERITVMASPIMVISY